MRERTKPALALKKKRIKHFQLVVGTLAVLLSPLSLAALSSLCDVTEEEGQIYLIDLHSVLDVPEGGESVQFLHESVRDFLFDQERCTNLDFWIDQKTAHSVVFHRCLALLSSLTQDICGLKKPGISINEIDRELVDRFISTDMRYACRYWVQHLEVSGHQVIDDGPVHDFFQKHFLYWLEASSLMGTLPESIQMFETLLRIIKVRLYQLYLEDTFHVLIRVVA